MADAADRQPVVEPEEEVWNAISAFEQILEVMPTDRASLEALSHAYEQIGDHTRAKDYLVRLGEVIIDETDRAGASRLIPQLRLYADEDPKARDVLDMLTGLGGDELPHEATETPQTPATENIQPPSHALPDVFSMADELAFAWMLMEMNQLTQEEYAAVVQDLTEMSSAEAETTVSVMHALELRAFKNLERLMANVSRECGAPLISLERFDISPRTLKALPITTMVRRGATVFDDIGSDALVVVMNPHDQQLRAGLEAALRCKCHFFMCMPSDFDARMTRLTEMLADLPS